MVNPHPIGCVASGNCDFCQDARCGDTGVILLANDYHPPSALGWNVCHRPECQVLADENWSSYEDTDKTAMMRAWTEMRVLRSTGSKETGWKCLSPVFRRSLEGSWCVHVAKVLDDGTYVMKRVRFDELVRWQHLDT